MNCSKGPFKKYGEGGGSTKSGQGEGVQKLDKLGEHTF